HVAAVDKVLSGELTGFNGLNLGTGQGLSVLEILSHARRVTGAEINIELKDRREGDPPALVANADAARTVLGWAPAHSDVETIIETAWRWEMRNRP
ncbi:MAG: UDP-glucose 4-epimerase GalE, partial [Pseudomonadota bacterium]